MVHAFNPSTGKVEAGGSLGVQGQPGAQGEFSSARDTKNPVSEQKVFKACYLLFTSTYVGTI